LVDFVRERLKKEKKLSKICEAVMTHCLAKDPKETKGILQLQQTATRCNALQRSAAHCNALQQTATDCNTLQHTAT